MGYEEITCLTKEFIEKIIFDKSDISKLFQKEYIVFSNFETKEWFKTFWLKNFDYVICGYDLITIDELCNILDPKNKKRFDHDHIFYELIKLLTKNDTLLSNYNNYIMDNGQINSNKLYDLATTLTEIFIDYNKNMYRPTNEEQSILFAKIFGTDDFETDFLKCNNKIWFYSLIDDDALCIYHQKAKKFIQDKYPECCFEFDLNSPKKDTNINVFTADTAILEIETIHRDICELAKKGELEKSSVLVLTPNIELYRTKIERVFNQQDKKYPNISYVINGNDNKSLSICNAFNIISRIISRGSIHRRDFVDLINNDYIRQVQHLDNTIIYEIQRMILEDNVFRDKDFQHLKNRLILGKLLGNTYDGSSKAKIENIILQPYSTIGLDDDQIEKIIVLIDKLTYAIEKFGYTETVNFKDKDEFVEMISYWFKSESEKYTNPTFYKYVHTINHFFDITSDTDVNYRLLYELLKNQKAVNNTNLFTYPVVFSQLSYDTVLPYKFVYFIGMSSNAYPHSNVISELDYNVNKTDIGTLEKKSFEFQKDLSFSVQSISYLRLDTINDAPYYPCIFVDQYFSNKTINYGVSYFCQSDDDIYTISSFRKRENLLIKPSETITPLVDKKSTCSALNTNTYKITELRDFLISPFETKIKKLVKNYELDENKLFEDYEPYSMNPLDYSSYLEDYVICKLKGNTYDYDTVKDDIKSSNTLRDDQIIDTQIRKIMYYGDEIYNSISDKIDMKIIKTHDKNHSLMVEDNTIILNTKFCYTIQEDKISIAKIKGDDTIKSIIEEYLSVICLIIMSNEDKEYQVEIYNFNKIMTISLHEARSMLLQLIETFKGFNKQVYFNLDNYIKKAKSKDKDKDLDNDKSKPQDSISIEAFDYDYNNFDYDNLRRFLDIYNQYCFTNETVLSEMGKIYDDISKIIGDLL